MPETSFRLGVFRGREGAFTGLVLGERIVDLARIVAVAPARLAVEARGGIEALLPDWDRNFERLLGLADLVRKSAPDSFQPVALADVVPLPPVPRPGRMLYAAANYRDHVAGMRRTFTSALAPVADGGRDPPLQPYLFGKLCRPTGAFDDILLPAGLARIDWEGELALVIGRRGRNIPEEKVVDHIAGYVTTNDVSCRDLMWREDRPSLRSDWVSGKSFDSFAPMGPFLTPRAFVPDHAGLAIRLWVNGVQKQDGNTRDMTIGIEAHVAYGSRRLTLEPGDVLATGTPAGTGQELGEFLAAGDIVEAEVEHCGRTRNRVVSGAAGYSE